MIGSAAKFLPLVSMIEKRVLIAVPGDYMDPVKIVIVEDHQSTLDGLNLGLSREPGFSVVGSFSNSDEALARIGELNADVVVLDLHLPGKLAPKSMIAEFCRFPTLNIIVFSAENRLAYVQAVMALGVAAYLLKSEPVSTLVQTIRQVMQGKRPILSDELTAGSKRFTRSEQEVLEMIGKGMKYQDIADERFTTVATVRKQCETLLLKLGLETREQLIAWSVKNGYGTDSK